MSEGLNKVMLLGNLGADPELKMTQNGATILKMRLATTSSYLDKEQKRQEVTEWHNVTLFGKRAEALAKFLTKGDQIFVEGALRTSSYEKDGQKRYSTEVVASNVILNGKRPAGSGDDAGSERRAAPSRAPAAAGGGGDFGGYSGDDSDIPF